MSPDEPGWWYATDPGWPAHALSPAAAVYDWAAQRRMARASPYRTDATVVCVGNFTVGGNGKTPLTLRVVAELAACGARPAILTRGYGGSLKGPVRVDATRHTAADVGDEPLLLARAAPTMVAGDRKAGARALMREPTPPDVIVMDDGMQNPSLAKDLTLAVVDAVRGVGNGLVVPAGPLRMDLRRQLEFVDAVIINGVDPDGADRVAHWFERHTHVPVLRAKPAPSGIAGTLAGQRVVAFAGIANPNRFERLLVEIGADVVTFLPFPDHHPFSPSECENLMAVARGADAVLVTTEKDWVRLSGSQSHDLLRATTTPVPITLAFEEKDAGRLTAMIGAAIARRRPTVSDPRPAAP